MAYKQFPKHLSTILGKIIKVLKRNKTLLAFLVIFFYTLYLLYPSFLCDGYLLNTDTYGHFYASWSSIASLKQGILFGNYDLYGGIDSFISYSPLFYYCFAFFYFLASKFVTLQLAWVIYLFLIVLFISFGIYYLLTKLGFNFLISLFASLFAISFRYSMLSDFSPSVMYEIGLAPFIFSFVFLPYFLVNFYNLINLPHTQKFVINSAIFLTLILLAHLYTFLAVIVFILFALIFKLISNLVERNKLNTKLLSTLLGFLILFLVTSSFWIYAFLVDKPYSTATSKDKLPVLSNVKYYSQFFHNSFGQRLDSKIPIILFFGLIGIITILLVKNNRKEKLYLFIFLVSSIALSFGISNLLFIPSTTSFSGAHVYGRALAFFKYFWIIFAVIGIYESVKLIVWLIARNNIVLGRYLIKFVSLLLLTIVLIFQIRLSKTQIRNYQAFKCFGPENNYYLDINNISSLVIDNRNLTGKILIDISFESSEKYIIPVLSGNHGLISHFPMDRTEVKAKKNTDQLYQSIIDHSENTISLVDKLGVDFVVIDKEKAKSDWSYSYFLANNFSIIYSNKLVLFERNGQSKFVESSNTKNTDRIVVDYKMPNIITITNPKMGDEYSIKVNYYPKWHAYQNGEEIPMLGPEDLSSLIIQSQDNTPIVLKYQDNLVQILLILLGATSVICYYLSSKK